MSLKAPKMARKFQSDVILPSISSKVFMVIQPKLLFMMYTDGIPYHVSSNIEFLTLLGQKRVIIFLL